MSTNTAKATGFNSSLDNGKEAIEALLTQQEESQESIEAQEEQVVEEAPEELEAEATEEVEEAEEFEDEEYDDELEEEELEANQVEEEGEEQPSIYTISVDGIEQEVTLDELKSGYSRQSDYTRKTQELANQRKQAETEFNAVREERAIYTQLLDQMRNQLDAGMQNEPDWVSLAENDPVGYNSQRAA